MIKNWQWAIGLLLLVLVFIWGSASNSQELTCSKNDPAQNLSDQYGEQAYSYAINHSGYLITTYVNHEVGSWSVIVRPPGKNLFCFLDSGDHFHLTDEAKKKSGKRTRS